MSVPDYDAPNVPPPVYTAGEPNVKLGQPTRVSSFTTSATDTANDNPNKIVAIDNTYPQNVALLVPLQGELATAGQAIRDGFMAAYNQFSISQRPQKITVIDSADTLSIQDNYTKAIQNGAHFVVGPLAKLQVKSIAQMSSLSVPTLTLNYIEPSESAPSELYQFGLSPLDEAKQAATNAWQNNERTALIITPATTWGQSVANAFQEQWQMLGGTVRDTLSYSSNNKELSNQLKNFLQYRQGNKRIAGQHRQDFDVIFLAADANTARQIKPLLKYYYAGNVPVYATSLVYSGIPQPALDTDLNGITFCDAPWVFNNTSVISTLRQQLADSSEDFTRHAKLYALGVDAYKTMMELNRLKSSSQQTLVGATGTLSMNNQHRIVRQLVCAQFRNGVPSLLNNNT